MVKYKIKSSKHHSLLHLTLTLTKSKVQKFNIIIFVFYTLNICGTFSLLSICHGFFFFSGSCIYLCYIFFYTCYIFPKKIKKTYYHIVMIINSKLEIGHNILKNIPSQNRSNRTLYTTLNQTALHILLQNYMV